ncbi:hypothetical protein HK102_006841 [Quaeritorhiza haematococci]|nr:hypothetical protein HK102_006841 [Quaeritorhiza haematococci]
MKPLPLLTLSAVLVGSLAINSFAYPSVPSALLASDATDSPAAAAAAGSPNPAQQQQQQQGQVEAPQNNRFDLNNYQPPGPSDVRSPCPYMNSLANHGLIERSGMDIAREDIFEAATKGTLLGDRVVNFFLDTAMTVGYTDANGVQRLDLDQLKKHGVIEHDGSLSRTDQSLDGESLAFNLTLYSDIYQFATNPPGPNQHITLDGLIKFRKFADRRCRSINPTCELKGLNIKPRVTAYGEAALVYLFLKDEKKVVPMKWMDELFINEKFPVESGWRPKKIGFAKLLGTVGKFGLKAGLTRSGN